MEEQALSATLEALRKGQCIAIMDLESKEAETNLFFPSAFFSPLKILKTKARGEMYIFEAHEIASTFGFPFIGEVSQTTHNSFSFISSKLPSFPLFKLLEKTVGSLVSSRILGIVLQWGSCSSAWLVQ
jgi:3,4-dihydroxy 2-butanone 4-phosphate synthase